MIHVRVFRRANRKFYEAYWEDPTTGQRKVKSTKTVVRRDAERFAARLENQLNSGQAAEPSRMTWAAFRERFEREVLPLHARKTQLKYRSTFNELEKLVKVKYLHAIDEHVIGTFTTKVRDKGRTELTIKGHMSCLRAALNWARESNLVARVPTFKMPRRVTTSGGRAISGEEFDRMLDAVPKALTIKQRGETPWIPSDEIVESWRHLLRGLWYSGLRIDEAMVLSWTDDRKMAVDLSGRYPMLRIHPSGEKGNQERMLPMAPEFAEFLEQTPMESRRGLVFSPKWKRRSVGQLRTDWVSKVVSKIGRTAGVKVRERENGRTKYASAHDLRRAFGLRWAMRVPTPVLMEMMRHENISTTMRFYIGRNADAAARQILDAYRNSEAGSSYTSGTKLDFQPADHFPGSPESA